MTRKKKIVENDKAKIAELIKELDQKKNEALKTAWQKVNKVGYTNTLEVSHVHTSSMMCTCISAHVSFWL